jgi:hypothetical protein
VRLDHLLSREHLFLLWSSSAAFLWLCRGVGLFRLSMLVVWGRVLEVWNLLVSRPWWAGVC